MSQEDVSRGSSSEDNAADPFCIPSPPHQRQSGASNELEKRLLALLVKRKDSIPANDLARSVGIKNKRGINPTLYSMEKKGWVRKVQESPPKWIILKGGEEALSSPGTYPGPTFQKNYPQKRGRGGGKAGQKRGRRSRGPFKARHDPNARFMEDQDRGSSNSRGKMPFPRLSGGSGFRDGSRWNPDESQERRETWQTPFNNFPNDTRNVSFRSSSSNSNSMEKTFDRVPSHFLGGHRDPASDRMPEPMDLTPATDREPSGGNLAPWEMHGFGRGLVRPPGETNYISPRKPGTDSHSLKVTLNRSADPYALTDCNKDSEGTSSQLPTFPHQMSGCSTQRGEPHINPGMGRGMGRIYQWNTAQRPGSSVLPTTHASAAVTGVGGQGDIDNKILQGLTLVGPLSTVDPGKAVFGKAASSGHIDPTLHKMQQSGKIPKVQDAPPTWSSGKQVDTRQSKEEEVEEVRTPVSMPRQTNPPLAPHLLLTAGNRGNTSHQEAANSSPIGQISQSSLPSSLSSIGAAPPPSSLSSVNVAEMMKVMNKNPISAFMEFGQSVQQQPVLELVSAAGPSHKPKFTFIARIGRRKFPPVVTQNKKDGRREAAEAAIRILAAEGAFQMSPGVNKSSEPGFGGSSFFDQIATLAHQTFNNLAVDIPECFSGKKVIAALIMKTDMNDIGRVIALGTGNRCVTGDKLSLEGQTVHDSHAEVVTRRAFMRYLYRQLKIYRTNPEKSILSPSPSGKLTTRDECTFHLYISTAPCGDGAQFSWTDNQGNEEGPQAEDLDFSGRAHHCPTQEKNIQGLLRTKMELGEGTIPIQEKHPIQTWDAILQNQQRLRTMSCSDKVCRWNILGLQGSLLSNFIEPIYLSSLTLGALYHHGHLARAVCCRMGHYLNSIDETTDALPLGYRINHPQLGHVTSPDPPRGTEKTKEFSVNWFAGCDNAEVTDGTVGRIKGVLPSRLSKMNLLKEFMEVSALYDRPLPDEADTYNQIKQTAEDFQKAKDFMKYLFRKGKAGTWVEKPIEVGMFPP